MLRLTVSDKHSSQRVDSFVAAQTKELSRAFVNKLVDDGKVAVNKKTVKPSHKLRAGDKVSVDFEPRKLSEIPSVELPVIYEDKGCIVINKPAGLLTHSKGAYNPEATVATFIKDKVQGLDGERAGIVHRLDRGTSGVIICAKNAEAHKFLQKQFSTRKVTKTYVALVKGKIEPSSAIIDMPIERNPKKPQTFRTGPNGKPAITKYKTLKVNNRYSLIELEPQTGRTHQLRVHLNQLGHPIVGDNFYGGEPADRLYLHALSLNISLPHGKKQLFKAPLPPAFNRMVK